MIDTDMVAFDKHVTDLTNAFAERAVGFLEELKDTLEKEEIASLMVAAAIQFYMKTMIVAGFSKEEMKKAVDLLYDPIKQNDIHAQLSEAMRESRKETKQ